ncbi:ABC transporter permease [Paraburkholderia silvatlantica]|uniref:Glycine betaine/proline transport system permease protein n=1 Tax=Paraburkholderia silvatlantica TaxID=321895 RepID=A0A2U1A660_9BURK|nr:proline/glycine betaine ABC transporter permease [Paraburkholderia silvatlantica]MBB2929232.1 glycine betaine/proline transport system permease protein [Paraburkholderia silvatlantica]PVY27261.1 glycine betaine/proline transport system permease protein [Paraburkholderia silvatlantica]PXW34290.1 glycine betaine/proline transport system permease protein [Paraburkholderia silvatlantica]PYE16179.1 glycine betaine/proline transport system permease protein [Paraburkholderia silvatlantica]TDQ85185
MFKADDLAVLPIADWIQTAVQWIALHLRPLFLVIKWPIQKLLELNIDALHAVPFPVFVLACALLVWRVAGKGVAAFTLIGLVVIAALGVWADAITTIALIVTAIVFCAAIGVPVGVACARSERVWRVVQPILDIMQTTPTFVYLVPVVMLFGVGTVPGEVAVVIAAMPPLIRFTNLGIRMVDHELVEAGLAFGADPRQLLWEVQLPLAVPTILGGLNQTVLTAMVMSVVISMIGAEGLGLVVLQGLGRLDVGQAAIGGIAIVLLAMILDRVTQKLARSQPGRGALRGVLGRFVRGGRADDAGDRLLDEREPKEAL